MADTIRIQMMDDFTLYVNERQADHMVNKTRKGVSLMQYLILSRGAQVPNTRLLATLWDEEKSINPENALKTLISRLRAILNQLSPDLGRCIVADRGAYHWETLPGMMIDVYEIEDIFERLSTKKDSPEDTRELCERLMKLYVGDLLVNAEQNEWALTRATALHNKYMNAVYTYIEILKDDNDWEHIAEVCRMALEVDNFDDRLHMELMTALIQTDRTADALNQYKYVMHLNYRYLGVQPSNDMQEFYKKIVRAGRSLDFNLESIRNELHESGEQRGAFYCEYAVFKEIFNLQMRNLERLGSTMFLGVIMVGDPDDPNMNSIKQDNIMNSLLEILKQNLRKGDTITHFSPTVFALLLPTVNYTTGNLVMERIKRLFYRKFPNSNIAFNYRVGPLSSDYRKELLSEGGTMPAPKEPED